MIDPKLRKLLVTLRAALIMASKAIEVYLGDESKAITIGESDSISIALPQN